ncbi:hypothetical protein C8Z91_33060 [Paenibacillus elgii]|uniref:Helix-turn-helix conjugative transposon-like domain-containing protein n=1 Tax=Paenibacillus elgii TaxID=189691 RepID=A0A2T6FS23_9BACL|nr:helix-turn-helix domain-containing protein [Paenibacillus elgii]PUA34711.1 hypothetical protein C8Z91_33060 [Paenibacillus elgii]
MNDSDLLELVIKAQNGDQEALSHLLQRFYPKVKRISKFRTKQEQEDMEQELMLLLIKTILAYDTQKTPDFTAFIAECGYSR